jgi:hypothetical protein
MMMILEAPRREGGCELDLSELEEEKCLEAFFPLHNRDDKDHLSSIWVVKYALPNQQPFDEIKVNS